MQPVRTSGINKAFNPKLLMRFVLANKAARLPAAIAGLIVTAFLVGALLPSGQKAAQSGPASQNSKVTSKTTPVRSSQVKPARLTPTSRRGVEFYTGDVRASMFSEPVSPAPKAPPAIASVKPVPPAPVDPFAEWNYTGTATIGDDKVAILENINTHDGVLLHVGDKFLGTKVSDIDGNLLTFGTGRTSKSLFVSMNTSYVPLSASAGFLTPKPEQTTQPGNFQALIASYLQNSKAATAAAPGGPSVTLPNGSVLTGNALTRYNRRLNRGWNGNTGAGPGR